MLVAFRNPLRGALQRQTLLILYEGMRRTSQQSWILTINVQLHLFFFSALLLMVPEGVARTSLLCLIHRGGPIKLQCLGPWHSNLPKPGFILLTVVQTQVLLTQPRALPELQGQLVSVLWAEEAFVKS